MNIDGKKSKLSTIALILLLTVSAILVALPNVSAEDNPNGLFQYEWTHPCGAPEGTYFVEGPAPDSPNVQWKITINEDLPNALS